MDELVNQYGFVNKNTVIEEIKKIEDEIREKTKDGTKNSNEITRLRYKQMLIGMHLNGLNCI